MEPVEPLIASEPILEPIAAYSTTEAPEGTVSLTQSEASGGTGEKIRKGLATALATLGIGAMSLGI